MEGKPGWARDKGTTLGQVLGDPVYLFGSTSELDLYSETSKGSRVLPSFERLHLAPLQAEEKTNRHFSIIYTMTNSLQIVNKKLTKNSQSTNFSYLQLSKNVI